jgi:transcription initiation factor TFIIIB Brf1 subunit/transcription initiation factor TFIIB
MEDSRFIRKRAIELLKSKVKEFRLPESVIPGAEKKLMRYEYWKEGCKRPTALAAASLYLELINTPITQDLISPIFEITSVTLRKYAQDMMSKLKLPGYTDKTGLYINVELIKKTLEEKKLIAAIQAEKEMQELKKQAEEKQIQAQEKAERFYIPNIQEIQEKKKNESIEYLRSTVKSKGLTDDYLTRAEEIIKKYQHKLTHRSSPSSVASTAYFIAAREKGRAISQEKVSIYFNTSKSTVGNNIAGMLFELNIELPKLPKKEMEKTSIQEIQEKKVKETLDLIKLKVEEKNLPPDAVPLAENLLDEYKQNITRTFSVPILATATYHIALNQNKYFIPLRRLSSIFGSNEYSSENRIREMIKQLNIPDFEAMESGLLPTPPYIEYPPLKYEIQSAPNGIVLEFQRSSEGNEIWFSQGEKKYAWVRLSKIDNKEKIIGLHEKMVEGGFKMPKLEEFETELMKAIEIFKTRV